MTVSTLYFSCIIWDNSICCQITLVSNQKFVNVITSIAVDFTEPLLHIIEALFIRHVINNLPKETVSKKCKEVQKTTESLLYLHYYVVRNITHNDSMCPTIVATGYCPKSFLTGSIPLQEKIVKQGKEKSVKTTFNLESEGHMA